MPNSKNKKETVQTKETALFTNIIQRNIAALPFSLCADAFTVIAALNNVDMQITEQNGQTMLMCRLRDFKKVQKIFINSVLYN